MAVGDGCLKPLHLTYGALQYHSSEVKSISLFFVLYFSMYNFGSIVSRLISPILRQDLQCFGNDDCFSVAFGISAIGMVLVALMTIVANQYTETEQADVEGNSLLSVFACIWVRLTKSN